MSVFPRDHVASEATCPGAMSLRCTEASVSGRTVGAPSVHSRPSCQPGPSEHSVELAASLRDLPHGAPCRHWYEPGPPCHVPMEPQRRAGQWAGRRGCPLHREPASFPRARGLLAPGSSELPSRLGPLWGFFTSTCLLVVIDNVFYI